MHNTTIRHPSLVQVAGLIKILRPKQWIKNCFVLAPLIFTGNFLNSQAVIPSFLAFVLFCIASSATYILNDIGDLENDKIHPRKSKIRPLASGIISLRMAIGLLTALYCLLVLGWFFAPKVLNIILAYLILNLAYTFILKHQPVVDIFSIAIGFVLRVYAGATALAVPVSGWMFITTLCLALYLAAIKRKQELSHVGTESRKVLTKYSAALVARYAEMSATGALVFYSMFVISAFPQLMITIPLVLFGLFRYWYIADQLDKGESPTDALMADFQLLLTVLLWIGTCMWALWPN